MDGVKEFKFKGVVKPTVTLLGGDRGTEMLDVISIDGVQGIKIREGFGCRWLDLFSLIDEKDIGKDLEIEITVKYKVQGER